MNIKRSVHLPIVLLVAVLALTAACNRAPSDSEISSQLQNKFSTDSGLQGKDLSVQAANGTVTLSGNVDNDAERDAAARYAAAIPGVKQVVNNLQIAAPAAAAATAPAPQAPAPAPVETPKPAPVKRVAARKHAVVRDAEMASAAPGAGAAGMGLAHQDSAPAAPATPPPPPPPPKATIPAGTNMAVRLVDAIDSEKNQPGETFRATLNSPLATEGDIAIPAGYDVEGHIVDVKSAGKFAGQSLLVLQLDRITVGGKSYSIQTDQYKRQGSSRGKNTAEKVGAGAAIGAIIGGIAGGGKGAAIGAAAGGGLGGGVQAATKGQQIKLPSETVLNFTLQNPVTVVVAQSPDSHRQRMDAPNN
jgi:hypothetical protein